MSSVFKMFEIRVVQKICEKVLTLKLELLQNMTMICN